MRLTIRCSSADYNSFKTIEVFKEFRDRMKGYQIKYANFNHYYKFDGDIPKIRIRFQFEDETAKTAAIAIAEELCNQNKIEMYGWDIIERENYLKLAHKMSTDCVVSLFDNSFLIKMARQSPEDKRLILKWFFYYFFKKFHIDLLFTPEQLGYLSETSRIVQKIKTNAENCYDICKDGFDCKKPEFIERFVHLFCNCALLPPSVESSLWDNLITNYSISVDGKGHKEIIIDVCKKIIGGAK